MITIRFYGPSNPAHGTLGSAAYDLHADQHTAIPINSTVLVPTGLHIDLPHGYVGLVCSRSGLATKGIFVTNAPGIVDSDYRGEIHVIITNLGVKDYVVERGDRIAQLLVIGPNGLEPDITWWKVNEHDELSFTGRGYGGFGSTGR